MPLTAEQGTFLLQMVLPALKHEHQTTMKVIQAAPVDKGDYRPEPNSMSALNLAWHIANAESMFLEAVITGAFDFNRPKPDSVQTTADVAAWYADRFAGNLAKIEALSGEELVRIVDFRGFMQREAVTYLDFSLRHLVHHRGQLSTYLRPMGGKVPSIYGESYDDAQARKAAGG